MCVGSHACVPFYREEEEIVRGAYGNRVIKSDTDTLTGYLPLFFH